MKNCISKMVAAFAAVLTLSSVSVSSAFADCTDTYWATSNEYVRRKDGDSSVYVYNQGSNPVSVSVYGSGASGGYFDVSSFPGYSSHSTTSLTVPSGTRVSIRQFINEKGYSYARLCVGNVYGTSSGVWSPDSTRDYALIN